MASALRKAEQSCLAGRRKAWRWRKRCTAGTIVRAQQLGAGDDDENAGVPPGAPSSYSVRAQERLTLIVACGELRAREARALNNEQYDLAQVAANRLADIEDKLNKNHVSRADVEEGVKLRSQLQAAVEEERYQDAAQLRDRLKALSEEMKYSRISPNFRLGYIVRHTTESWRGVVCGIDEQCEEGEDWLQRNGDANNSKNEIHYVVLIDERDVTCTSSSGPPAAYVPESQLQGIDDPPEEGIDNIFTSRLTIGRDYEGHYLPTRQVREFHKQERKDIWPKSSSGQSDSPF